MKLCKYKQEFPNDNEIHCMAYSNSKREDGRFWAHFPICKTENCPLKQKQLLEGAVLENETLD